MAHFRSKTARAQLSAMASTYGLATLLASTLPLAASPARADDPAPSAPGVQLAAPGPCAEPREALSGASMIEGPGLGSLEALFSPVAVAAAPPPTRRGPPAAPERVRPGACDDPGSGGCSMRGSGPVSTASVASDPPNNTRINPPARPSRPRPR